MRTLESATIAKVGSSSLYCPSNFERNDVAFHNIATQMQKIDNGLLISSGAYLAAKQVLPHVDNTGLLTSIGWKKLLDVWEEHFEEPIPSILAEEFHFAPHNKTGETAFDNILQTLLAAWKFRKTVIANQNDPVSSVGLSSKVLNVEDGIPKFFGDNDLFAAKVAISLVTSKIANEVNLAILSGDKNGLLDGQGKTIPFVNIKDLQALADEKPDPSRAQANGLETKAPAMIQAAKAGVNVSWGSAQSPTAILEGAQLRTQETITRIVQNITQI